MAYTIEIWREHNVEIERKKYLEDKHTKEF